MLFILSLLASCVKNESTKIRIDNSCPVNKATKLPAIVELIVTMKQELPERVEVRYGDELIYSDCESFPEEPEGVLPRFEANRKRVLVREYYDEVIPPKKFELTIFDMDNCISKNDPKEFYYLKVDGIKYQETKPYGSHCPQVQKKFSKTYRQR